MSIGAVVLPATVFYAIRDIGSRGGGGGGARGA